MVGIIVDDDVVTGPVPIVDVGEVEGGDAEVEAVKPEAAGTTAGEMPDVAAAEAASEMAVSPGMIEVEASIFAALFMADPVALFVNVRTGGRGAVCIGRGSGGMATSGRWAAFGDRRMSSLGMFSGPLLRESRNGAKQEQRTNG